MKTHCQLKYSFAAFRTNIYNTTSDLNYHCCSGNIFNGKTYRSFCMKLYLLAMSKVSPIKYNQHKCLNVSWWKTRMMEMINFTVESSRAFKHTPRTIDTRKYWEWKKYSLPWRNKRLTTGYAIADCQPITHRYN